MMMAGAVGLVKSVACAALLGRPADIESRSLVLAVGLAVQDKGVNVHQYRAALVEKDLARVGQFDAADASRQKLDAT
jgi:hypothetical protein